MFDGKYFEWNQKRTKGIVDHYGYQFFYGKKVVDLGCGYADISGSLYRLGADVTTVDARQEHLKIVSKKFQGIKVFKANLDGPWPFIGQKFDLILDLGLICHLNSFEEHLKSVCASTTHLVLETAVCDSDDPDKCVIVSEGKDVYDLAYNGMGCRPTAAAIEKILTQCGMSFKRVDSSKFNVGDYVYDWQPQNNNSTSLNKRRIWFATKINNAVFPLNNIPETIVSITPPNIGYSAPIQSSGIPIALATKISKNQNAVSRVPDPITYNNTPVGIINNYMDPPSAMNYQITKISKENALVTPEIYSPPITFDTNALVFPNTTSSKLWIKKIAPLFPNLKISTKAYSLHSFNKSDNTPDVVMCRIGDLISNKRIWIEEWLDGLQPGDIEVLKKCETIMTPSLINAQEILNVLPEANVIRVDKPWPMLPIAATRTNYLLYFEKNPDITQILVNSWSASFMKLIVIGTRTKIPNFVENVLDTADYSYIISLLMGANAIIDINSNNYYMSGILKLAQNLSLPIITNNQTYLNQENSFLIDQQGNNITAESIHNSINKFLNTANRLSASYDESYNNIINEGLKKLIGA